MEGTEGRKAVSKAEIWQQSNEREGSDRFMGKKSQERKGGGLEASDRNRRIKIGEGNGRRRSARGTKVNQWIWVM